jgi:outer membrane protein TolC
VLNPTLRANLSASLKADAGFDFFSADQFPLPELGPHRFDPRRPLDVDEVAMIAVANNPTLRATRSRIGVAEAQVFAAGILPNPQLSFEYGFFLGGPGTTNSVLAGLSQEVLPLLTPSTRQNAARASEMSVKLDVVWQEWQIVRRARLLFVDAISFAKQRRLIEKNLQLFKQRYERSYQAMQAGNEVLPTVASDLVALNAAETQLNDIDQFVLKNKHDLNALLGLTPDAELQPANAASLPALDADALQSLLLDLAARRPDLIALRAGYQAQEERVWRAVVEQFPRLSVGSTSVRDPTDVRTQSLAITISLPIFDRNQGNIAVEHATREQLRQEYQARLDTADGEAKRLISELQLAEEQYRSSVDSVRRLGDAVAGPPVIRSVFSAICKPRSRSFVHSLSRLLDLPQLPARRALRAAVPLLLISRTGGVTGTTLTSGLTTSGYFMRA